MSRERDIAKNTFIFTAGRIAAQFAAFLLLPLYSALLTPEDYGTADLLNTIVFFIVPFIGIQLDTALFRYTVECRDNREKQTELFSTVIAVNLIQCLLFFALYMAARPFITLLYKDYILINAVLLILINTHLQFMRGLGMNVRYSAAVFITSFSSLIINVILVAGLGWGVAGIIVGSTSSQALTLLFAVIALRPWQYIRFGKYNKDTSRALLKYSLPLVPNQLAWWVMVISDRVLISGAIGIAANGIYSLANKFSSIYTSVTDSINLSWTESASLHFGDKDGKKFISGMLDRLFILFASGCFVFLTLIPYAFFIINTNYSESYNQIPILLLAALSQAAVGLYSSILIAAKKTKSIAVTSIICAVTNLVIDIALVRQIGIYAGSISTLAAFTTLAVLRCITVKRSFDVSPSFKVILGAVIWGSAVTFCYYLNDPYVNAASVILSLAIAFIANRRILGMIISLINNKMFSMKHKRRIRDIYGKLELYEGRNNISFKNDLLKDRDLNGLITYKDESWNYIKNLRLYQRYLGKGKHPDWEDNDCISDKYVIEDNVIRVNTKPSADNWLCFYVNEPLPGSFELSYDICLHTEFTEVQAAFNYTDLGNRYRFMIKNNKVCLFEVVYEGDFLDSYKEVPFSLSLHDTHRICVRVTENIYEYYVDDIRILAVKENAPILLHGGKACLILWNETDSAAIECDISNIRIRGL